MQNFIVLGYIPGTDYQTDLTFWLVVALLFAALLFLSRIIALIDQLRQYLVLRKIARTIDKFDLVTI